MANKIEYATKADLDALKTSMDDWMRSFQSSIQEVSQMTLVVNNNMNNIKRQNDVLTYALEKIRLIIKTLGMLSRTQKDTAKFLVQVSKNVQRNSP